METRAAKDKDVKPSIVIIIKECNATTYRFQKVVFSAYRAVNCRRRKTRLLGNVCKSSKKRYSRRLSARGRHDPSGGHPLSSHDQRRCKQKQHLASGQFKRTMKIIRWLSVLAVSQTCIFAPDLPSCCCTIGPFSRFTEVPEQASRKNSPQRRKAFRATHLSRLPSDAFVLKSHCQT